MKYHISELNISVGLPASGKTTLFSKLSKGSHGSYYLGCDSYLKRSGYTMERLLKDRAYSLRNVVYIDGLFLTKEDIKKVLDILVSEKIKIDKVIIHYFQGDKDTLKWNDIGRREQDSKITIDNANMDSIKDIMTISGDFKDIKFVNKIHSVVKKEAWKTFSEIHNLFADEYGIAKGDDWSLGGTWCDCWGNSGTCSPETPPEGVRLLDDLLEKVAPTIPFLQYRKIMNECVSIREFSHGDWYGGTTYHNQHLIDIKKLYGYLVEKGFIEEIKVD